VCRQLAARGLRVVLTARDRKKADAAARSLVEEAGEIVGLQLDVTDEKSIRDAAEEVERRAWRVDVLVNNAAILVGETAGVIEIPVDDYRRTFETNLFGPMTVCQAFVPGMMQRRYGRVVNVSSQAGQLAKMRSYAPAYSISKTALNGFTRQLAAATERSGVLVNSACPGWVRTDMGGKGAPRSVQQGADTIVWLATLPSNGPTGGFFADRKPLDW
jgi:NAD(P)-dependent dehydrogenase (short-subunit alcohol dehydrogenase family)